MDTVKTFSLVFLVVGLSQEAGSQTFQCDRCYTETGFCRTVTGTFEVSVMSEGYNPVVTIPAGACYINLTEEAYSGNALALKASGGEYILNGDWMINGSGLYAGVGTVFKYSRKDHGCPGECIRATGPTNDKVTVQLLYHVRNPGVHYSYQIPTDEQLLEAIQQNTQALRSVPSSGSSKSETPGTRSELKAHEIGSRTLQPKGADGAPGSGSFPVFSPVPLESSLHRRQPIFTSEFKYASRLNRRHQERISRHRTGSRRQFVGARRQALTDKTFSRGLNDDAAQADNTVSETGDPLDIPYVANQPSNEVTVDTLTGSGDGISLTPYLDTYAWKVSGYAQCTRVCGGGIQEVSYICDSEDTGLVVGNQLCANAIQPEGQYRVCNDEPCTPEWNVDTWSTCTVSCGNGTQSREVACQQRVSATVTLDLADTHCTSLKPNSARPCYMMESCYKWKTTKWGQCSVSCGIGSRQREVECQDTSGNIVPSTHCDGSLATTDTCDMGSCSRDWYFTVWTGQCTEDCENGVMTRQVYCASGSGQVLPDGKCAMTQKPSNEKPCTKQRACKGQWFTGPWSKCSRSCGDGSKRRSVVCMKSVNRKMKPLLDDQCNIQHKPETTEPCTQVPCNTTWYMTDWSKCSASCGGGTRTRSARCLSQDLQASIECEDTDKPDIYQSCNTDKCITRPHNIRCRDRYPNCGVVVGARLCRYPYYQRKCCLSCSSRRV